MKRIALKRAVSFWFALLIMVGSFLIVSLLSGLNINAEENDLVTYRFDLGGLDVADGYIGVSAEDQYSDEVGYGFRRTNAVENTTASGEGALADAVRFLNVDGRVFQVKLDPGVYKITVTTGDVNSATITAEGLEQLYFLTGSNASDSFTIPVTDGRLDLYTCQGVGGDYSISAVEIEQISKTTETKPVIWIYGDSTVCNYYNVSDTHNHGWGQYLKEYIDTEAFEIRNMAINGMSAKLLSGHESFNVMEYYGKPGDILLLSIGINDYRSDSISSSDYREAIRSLVKRAKEKSVKVYLVKQQGMLYDIAKYPVLDKQWYSDEIDQIASEENVASINLFQYWLEFSLEHTNDIMPQYYATSKNGSTDEIHQNLKGAKVLASMMANALFPIAKQESEDNSNQYDLEFGGNSTVTYGVEVDGTGPMRNPHKGFVMDVGAPYQFESDYSFGTGIGGSKDNHAWDVVSICYGVQKWNELNPERGSYNWKPIDDMLKACAKHGMTYGIRILPYSTGSGSDDDYGASHNFVPQWVFDNGAVMDRVTYKYNHPGVYIDVPQWSNQHYIDAYKEFITALAAQYDGDPRVEFIEIRPFGNFGEWHTSQFVGNDMPSIEQQKDMLKFFADSFSKTTLQMLSDVKGEVYDYGLSLGLSKRNDGLIMTVNEEWDLRPVYRANLPVAGDYHNQYKYMRYTLLENNPYNYLTWTPERFRETIEIPHLTMLSLGMDSTFGVQIYQEEKDLIDEMSHRIGYNFVVTEAKRNGNKLLVKIKNTGLAPAFFDIDLCAEIIDEDGNKLSIFGNPITIPNGTFHDEEEKAFVFECEDEFQKDSIIGLAMYETDKEADSKAAVRFDNKNMLSTNRLKLVAPSKQSGNESGNESGGGLESGDNTSEDSKPDNIDSKDTIGNSTIGDSKTDNLDDKDSTTKNQETEDLTANRPSAESTMPPKITIAGSLYVLNKDGEYVSEKAPKSSIKKVVSGKRQVKVKWKKVSKISGYQLQYSTSSKFTKKTSKKIFVKKYKTITKTIKKLKSKKKYYVRIRTYKTAVVNERNVKIYSTWSKAKKVKIK